MVYVFNLSRLKSDNRFVFFINRKIKLLIHINITIYTISDCSSRSSVVFIIIYTTFYGRCLIFCCNNSIYLRYTTEMAIAMASRRLLIVGLGLLATVNPFISRH